MPFILLTMVTCHRPVLTLRGSRVAAKRAVAVKRTATRKINFRISSSLRFLEHWVVYTQTEHAARAKGRATKKIFGGNFSNRSDANNPSMRALIQCDWPL